MKKIILAAFAATLIFTLVLSGCQPDPNANNYATKTWVQNQKYASQDDLAGKASQKDLEALQKTVANGTSFNPNNYYNTAQVDQLVKDMKNDILKEMADNGGSSNNNDDDADNGAPDGNGVKIDQDGQIILYLDWSDPTNDPIFFNKGIDNARWGLVIKNIDDTPSRFKLNIRLTPNEDVMINQAETKVSANPSLGDWTVTRNDWLTANQNEIYFKMDDKYFIAGDGAEDDYAISVVLDSEDSVSWDYRITIEEY